MKPVIGVVPLVDYGKKSYWMLPGYMKGIEAAGGIPVMLPLINNETDIKGIVNSCSGILFTGGQDVSPNIYGEVASHCCGEISVERDTMEGVILTEVIKSNIPFLGICRGIQFINSYLGGSLYQDLPKEFNSNLEHHQSPPYDRPIHKVIIEKGSPLHNLLNKEVLPVNSYHHQGIKELSPKLDIMAKATDGIVEAVYLKEHKFGWAVQWHPELNYNTDNNSLKILSLFVKQCR